MTNKDPIEIIQEMHAMILSLKDQIVVMDSNIKLLNAKFNSELLRGVQQATVPQVESAPKPPLAADEPPKPQISVPDATPTEESGNKNAIVSGKVLSDEGKPISGVHIKILNADKKVIKETTTNRAGLWTVHLRPGKYICKIVHESRPTQFKMFDVEPDQTKIEV